MLASGFKVFLRYLIRNKLFSLINIAGLGVGLASVLLLALYVLDEFSFDRQHPDVERKYRIETIVSSGNEVIEIDIAAAPTLPLLAENFPEVDSSTRYWLAPMYLGLTTEQGSGYTEDKVAFADPNIAEFFTFEWLQGDTKTALTDLNSIVLTESLARKYFGDEDPLGKTLQIDQRLPLTVTGVLKDRLGNSHIDATAFVPIEALRSLRGADTFESWFSVGFYSYVQLGEGAAMEALWPAMQALILNSMPPNARAIFAPAWRPVTAIYLDERNNPAEQRTRLDDLIMLIGTGIAMLIVACINFVNLATARSTERQKEIAIRKVAGSGRRQIFMQHLSESMCMVLLALLVGLGFTELSLPLVNSLTGKNLELLHNGMFWLAAGGIFLLVGVAAGAYPALYLSGFKPMAILRQRQPGGAGLLSFRNLLVVFQFSIAIIAIVATTVMLQQLRLAKSIELGFDKERVLVIENSPGQQWDTFKRLIRERTAVEQISAALSRPFRSIMTANIVRIDGSDEQQTVQQFLVDFGYFELFSVEVLAGRVFSDAFASDRMPIPTDEQPHPSASFVLNESMVKQLGWTSEEAVGKRIEMADRDGFERSVMGEVIGVVADMRVDSIQRATAPQIYFVPTGNGPFDFIFLKLPEGDPASILVQVEATWRELYPETPINRYFLDSKFQELYLREEKRASLVSVFAALAVFISCLGLIGLASYTTEQRTKEIGVRKAVGASVWQIVVLFSADFSRLVLVSNVIAWPIAYVTMQRWLQNFAYRIDLTPLVFIGSGLIALCIVWVTVGGTAAYAASAKPVLALRYE